MTQRHPIQNEAPMLLTAVTRDRAPFFRHAPYANEAVEQLYRTQEVCPFFIHAFVVMPDHVHLLVRVPEPGTAANLMRTYKMGLAFQTGLAGMWQSRFHLRLVRDLWAMTEYVHQNPVRADIADAADHYPWSSASGMWDVTLATPAHK